LYVYILARSVFERKAVRKVYGLVKEGESWRIKEKPKR
jgi:hypothetical protein